MPQRDAQQWTVYRNGQVDPNLQVLKIEESAGARRVDHAELTIDPAKANRIEDYSAGSDLGDDIEIVANGAGVKHWGRLSIVQPMFSPRGETYKLVSRTEHFLFGRPNGGTWMWQPLNAPPPNEPIFSEPEPPQFRLVDDPVVFNPEIDGRTVGNRHSAKTMTAQQVPVFLDPEAVRTPAGRSLHQGRALDWTLSEAVYYLCWTLNPLQKWIDNPSRAELQAVFTDSIDLVRNAQIKEGAYLPEALDQLLAPLGYLWRLARPARLARRIEFFRRGTGGNQQWLYHQRYGEAIDRAKTNVEANGVLFDSSRTVNRIIGQGSHLQVEITAELVRGWTDYYDTAAADDLKLSVIKDEAPDDVDRLNAYRKWVLNEGGDYIGSRDEITAPFTPTVLNGLDAEGLLQWFVPRRRKLMPTLTRNADGSAPIGTVQGVEVEFQGVSGAWAPAGNWGIELLEAEAGIYISAEDIPEELIDAGDDAKIRVTATIEADFRLTAIADRRPESLQGEPTTAHLDVSGDFHWRVVSEISKYAESDNESTAVDDLLVLQSYVNALRERWDQVEVIGGVTLEGVDQHQYAVGDRILGIQGRNISYRAVSAGDAYPQVVGITYDVTSQKTILQLQRFRELIL